MILQCDPKTNQQMTHMKSVPMSKQLMVSISSMTFIASFFGYLPLVVDELVVVVVIVVVSALELFCFLGGHVSKTEYCMLPHLLSRSSPSILLSHWNWKHH